MNVRLKKPNSHLLLNNGCVCGKSFNYKLICLCQRVHLVHCFANLSLNETFEVNEDNFCKINHLLHCARIKTFELNKLKKDKIISNQISSYDANIHV